jgi:hypothetical protein
MDTTAIEALRRFTIEKELPRRETALFGVRCPYCGKSDRIRRLEDPEALDDSLTIEERLCYSDLWSKVVSPDLSLGVCRFCLNLLELSEDLRKAQELFEYGRVGHED